MDAEHKAAFEALETQAKAQGETLKAISGNVEEIKESIHGQAMAINEVAHPRELCRAQMEKQVGNAATAAKGADKKAELAHTRVTGLKRAAWGLVIIALVQMFTLIAWLIKTAVAVGAGG